jgi:hypothetical protein
VWEKIMYDEPGDALAKLIVIEIKREMWQSIVDATPPSEKVRRTALKLAYRTISVLVTPPVSAAWNAAFAASKDARKMVADTLSKAFVVVCSTKLEIKRKLQEGMATALKPVTDLLSHVIGGALRALIPAMVRAMATSYARALPVQEKITAALRAGDEEKIKEVGNMLTDAKKEATEKIDEAMQKVSVFSPPSPSTLFLALSHTCSFCALFNYQ